MRIETIRIENFRGFDDATIQLDDYTCFVGPNGAGKSTVLAALNVFFRQYKDSKTDLSKLSAEDFHHGNLDKPIKITVTFDSLSDEAKADLSDYVRQEKLIISAVATYDPAIQRAEVFQYGSRLGIDAFRKYFEEEKDGKKVSELREVYADLKAKFPELPKASTKAQMADELRKYEAARPTECTEIQSQDQFYGVSRGANRLDKHLQWVFVPAVKDITEESEESRNSGLGQLLSRTIRSKVSFTKRVSELRDGLRSEYQKMLEEEQEVLREISVSLETKLQSWAHPDVTANILWKEDPDKSVKVEEPWAYIKLSERGFSGELARFGHGMQRSYMLTLLQEIATIESDSQPTLILAIEEPELFQHPPQARYLSEVLQELVESSSQIIICSHSPFFIPGDNVESVRIVRECDEPAKSNVSRLTYGELEKELSSSGQKPLKEKGILAKLYPSLNPGINEMFFCKFLILVEGIEDAAHIMTYLSLNNLLTRYRRCGCHIVPTDGKSKIVKPLAMAKILGIPSYVIFDADTDKTRSGEVDMHKKDNKSILTLKGHFNNNEWPSTSLWFNDLTVWKRNITSDIGDELGSNWETHKEKARIYYGQPGDLDKNPLAVARALESAWINGLKSPSLIKLTESIVKCAENALGIKSVK